MNYWDTVFASGMGYILASFIMECIAKPLTAWLFRNRTERD